MSLCAVRRFVHALSRKFPDHQVPDVISVSVGHNNRWEGELVGGEGHTSFPHTSTQPTSPRAPPRGHDHDDTHESNVLFTHACRIETSHIRFYV